MIDLYSILGSKLAPKSIKNWSWYQKVKIMKIALSCKRERNVQRSEGCKIIQNKSNIDQKIIQKLDQLFDWLFIDFDSILDCQIDPKLIKRRSKEFIKQIMEFWSQFWSIWVRFSVQFWAQEGGTKGIERTCFAHGAKTRPKSLETSPNSPQDPSKTLPGTLQEPSKTPKTCSKALNNDCWWFVLNCWWI